jgi:hypothetical protein
VAIDVMVESGGWKAVWRPERACELLEVLGHLPLAIAQAAVYIGENSIMVKEYLEAIYAEVTEIRSLV